jgi:hypothetical protein
MTEHEASRTLVKSPPELWAECSEAASLTRHLGEFGEIKITRLDPETAVAWEGERASGTVRIEPSGWGTRVTLTAQVEVTDLEPAPPAEPAPEPEPAPPPEPEPEPAPEPVTVPPAAPEPEPIVAAQQPQVRAGWLVRLRMRLYPSQPDAAPAAATPPPPDPEPRASEPEPVAAVEPEPEPVAVVEPVAAPEPEAPEPEPEIDTEQILVGALESLGAAHHRPFSRS